MMLRRLRLCVLLFPLLAGACATGSVDDRRSNSPVPTKLAICHGYGCRDKANLPVTKPVSDRFNAIMAYAAPTPQAEREAISKAVQYFEDLSAEAIGARDSPRSTVVDAGMKGQMDCIDESTNTRHLLFYLRARGLLKHHEVASNASRGILIDGRYPHWTAVIFDREGRKWAVDSWYEAAGGPPDIQPLDYWRTRGVMGER